MILFVSIIQLPLQALNLKSYSIELNIQIAISCSQEIQFIPSTEIVILKSLILVLPFSQLLFNIGQFILNNPQLSLISIIPAIDLFLLPSQLVLKVQIHFLDILSQILGFIFIVFPIPDLALKLFVELIALPIKFSHIVSELVAKPIILVFELRILRFQV